MGAELAHRQQRVGVVGRESQRRVEVHPRAGVVLVEADEQLAEPDVGARRLRRITRERGDAAPRANGAFEVLRQIGDVGQPPQRVEVVRASGERLLERTARGEEIRAALSRRVAVEPLAHWERVLPAAGIAYGAVQDLAGLVTDPHVRERGLLQTLEGHQYLRQPLVIDGTAPGPRTKVPGLGEHTEEVLREAGMSEETMSAVLSAN